MQNASNTLKMHCPNVVLGRVGMRIITIALLHSSDTANSLLNSINAMTMSCGKICSGKTLTIDNDYNGNTKGVMHQGDVFCSPIHLIKNHENHYQKQHQSTKEDAFPLLSNDKEELSSTISNYKQIQSKQQCENHNEHQMKKNPTNQIKTTM